MQFLYNLQKKPKFVRKNYALAFASTFTGVVALFWFLGTVNQNTLTGAEMAVSEENTPFSNLIKQSKEQLANVGESLGDGEVEENESEITNNNVNPLNISLSEEDIDIAKQNEPDPNRVYISTSTMKNDNSLFGNNERVYQEVMIATTSSTSTRIKVDERATTSDSWF